MTNHKNFFKQFVEFINTADENLAQQLINPTAKFYAPSQVEPLIGPAGYLKTILMMREGFPDIQWHLEEIISENDKSAIRFTMTGTHKGTFLGFLQLERALKYKLLIFIVLLIIRLQKNMDNLIY